MTDASAAGPEKRRAPRWMWIVMVLSLALNLLVIGIGAGALWHFRFAFAMHGDVPPSFGHYVATLPHERRHEIKDLLDEERAVVGPLRKRAREARRAVVRAFTSEPFSPEVLSKANDEAVAARIALTRARQQLFPKIATLMTAEERRDFLDWRRHRRRHWRWRRWHGERE